MNSMRTDARTTAPGPRAALAHRQRGVTMVELGVALAIVAILAAMVMPVMLENSAKGRRSDGQSMLLKTAQRMKTFYTENNGFTTDLSNLGYSSPTLSPEGNYTISVIASTGACPIASCFRLQAVPAGNHVGDRCGTLTMGSVGDPGADDTNCW